MSNAVSTLATTDHDEVHQIGAVAERVGLSLRTIRHYEEVGLVTPTGRSAGGFRLYTDADVDRLSQVKVMKPLGFSLEETHEVLELLDKVRSDTSSPDEAARLERLADRASAQCVELRDRLERAEEFARELSCR